MGATWATRSVLVFVVLCGLVFAEKAYAAGPVITSVGHQQRHPEATWSKPTGGDSWVLEIATGPETGSNGYFFEEKRVVFEILSPSQTQFLDDERLDPGTYYVHVSTWNNLCDPCVEWSQVVQLVIELPPPAPPPPRYEASVRSIQRFNPGGPFLGRNWTYRGDWVRIAFRNRVGRAGETRSYVVCYTRNRSLACRRRTIRGRAWDAWKLRIMPPWAGYVNGRYRRFVEFTWRASGRTVARKRIWIWE